MNIIYRICCFLFFSVVSTTAFSQVKDSSFVGMVKGVALDSAHNYVLQSATIAVYKIKDSSLISYQLSNNFGEFQFKELPVGIPLKIVISYSGYQSFNKKFIIPADKKEIDLSNLNVERLTNQLDEVVIEYVPPVRMNGDTLEFNASAFKLDKNAVVEDLLRKLPGVTIWGDGVIMVNGKEVSSLLVDGKPFFGGDSKVAIQNLPKTAIDKIQVYQQNQDVENPLDSVTQVNIKLRKDKRAGKFGKIGGGYGTRDRFEADGSINFFSPHTQFGIVAAGNNVNKIANNANSLMRNSTYKNNGVSLEYQPNFRAQGLNRPGSGGFTFQQDFLENPAWQKKDRISADYFIRNNDNENLRQTQTLTTFTGDSSRIQNNVSVNNSVNTNQNFNFKYEKETEKYSFNISPVFNAETRNNHREQKRNSSSSTQGLQSTNNTINNGSNDSKNMQVRVEYNARKDYLKNRRFPSDDFQVDYTLYTGQDNSEQNNLTDFVSLLNPNENKKYDRKYNNQSKSFNHSLTFQSGDLKRLIFGYHNFAGIILRLQNNLSINARNEDRIVKDIDTISKVYIPNQYLSNSTKYSTFNEMPALTLRKNFNKGLTNRYSKNVSIYFSARWQFYNQKNISDHSFQNIDGSYQKFIPNANINYTNNQFGDYQTTYSLRYSATSGYPNVNQIAPLVDSSNLYSIQKGNVDLKPYDKRELSFSLNHNNNKSKTTFNYAMNVQAGFINNNIIDSSIIDNSGRTTHYSVNANGNKYINISGNLNKAFKLNDHQIQVNFSTSFGISKNPNYVNSILNFSDNFNNRYNVNLYYTLKDFLAINLGQSLSFYNSKQSGFNNRKFGNSNKATSLSASASLTKKISLSSNVSYNQSASTNANNIDFTIWNANANYRFLKGNNAELKFAALDLLHQNISVINYGSNNNLTTGTVNVLQNYYIVTFSYFPRRFGKNKRRNKK